jgi:hypothetical protein
MVHIAALQPNDCFATERYSISNALHGEGYARCLAAALYIANYWQIIDSAKLKWQPKTEYHTLIAKQKIT